MILHRSKVFAGRSTRRPCNWWVVAGLLAALAPSFAGCGSGGGESSESSDAAAPAAASRTEPHDADHPVVEIATSAGPIRVQLDAVNAPITVRNFLFYADQGFYEDTLIHFVDPDKMILGGGYSVDMQAKPVGTTIRNEAHNGLKNVRGTIAMARDAAAGIDTATSQFFINLADAPALDHRGDEASEYGYCVFGEVIDGLDVADEISRASSNDHGGDLAKTPVSPVVVKSVRVVE